MASTKTGAVQAAVLQIQSRDFNAARYTLDKALLGGQSYPPALALRARLELESGNLAEAERRVNQMATGLGQAETLRLTGEIRMAQRRYAEAIVAFKAAYMANPQSDNAFGLYHAYLAAGQPDAAVRHMERWHQKNPKDRVAMHALAEGLMMVRAHERAKTLYQTLLSEDAKDPRAHNNLAIVLLQLGDAAALTHAERAHKLAPMQPQVNDTLGWVLVQHGQLEKGLRYLREAALRAPDDPDIQKHLNAALAKSR